MKILDKTNNGLSWCYNILILSEDIKQAIQQKTQEIAKKVRLDGFRPGKVPLNIIERMYGANARSEAIKGLISSAVKDVFSIDNLNISFNYSTEVLSEDDEGIKFTLKFEALPIVELKDLSDVSISKYIVDLKDEDINNFLEDIRKEKTKWISDDAKEALEGDKIVLNMVINPKKTKKLKQPPMNDIEIVLGDKDLINGISQNLLSAKVGDSREFDITYPENFTDKTLAGKVISYIANIKHVYSPAKYKMDDEFAVSIGKTNLLSTKEWAKKVLQSKYEFMAKDFMRRDLLDRMEEKYDFEVPQNMLNLEFSEVFENVKREFLKSGKSIPETLEGDCKKVALRRVRLGFVVAEIAKRDQIYVTNEELNEAIRNIIYNYPGREREIFDRCIKDKSMLTAIKGPILENKVINHLFSIINIEEKHCSSVEMNKMDEDLADVFHYEDSAKANVNNNILEKIEDDTSLTKKEALKTEKTSSEKKDDLNSEKGKKESSSKSSKKTSKPKADAAGTKLKKASSSKKKKTEE